MFPSSGSFPSSGGFPATASFPGAGAVVYDAAVTDYQARIVAAGGTISTTELDAINTAVLAWKAQGIWNNLIEICPVAGSGLNAALVKLKFLSTSTLTNSGVLASDYSPSTGIRGGTGKFLNTNVKPSDIGNTGGFGAYLREATGDVNKAFIGCEGSSSDFFALGRFSSGLQDAFRYFGGTPGSAGITQSNTPGYFEGSRTGESISRLYKNGVQIASNTTTPGTAFVNLNLYLLAINKNGGVSAVCDKYLGFVCINNGLTATQMTANYTIVHNLMTALGRNI